MNLFLTTGIDLLDVSSLWARLEIHPMPNSGASDFQRPPPPAPIPASPRPPVPGPQLSRPAYPLFPPVSPDAQSAPAPPSPGPRSPQSPASPMSLLYWTPLSPPYPWRSLVSCLQHPGSPWWSLGLLSPPSPLASLPRPQPLHALNIFSHTRNPRDSGVDTLGCAYCEEVSRHIRIPKNHSDPDIS